MRNALAVYRLGAAVARQLPSRLISPLATLASRVLQYAMPDRVTQIRLHQQRLTGGTLTSEQLARQVKANLCSYSNYWLQSFRLLDVSKSRIADQIEVEGQQHCDAAFAAGKGAVCVMPHIGLWDLGGTWLASRYSLTVVAERFEPPELFDWFVNMRSANGMEVVALGDDTAGAALLKRLRAGGFVGLLCDRDINHDGVEVEFFGERTTMSAGPATLSLRTGAPILPTAVYARPGQKALGVIRAPIVFERSGRLRDDVARLTQLVANELEALISAAPEQWHVIQPNWPSDPGWTGPTFSRPSNQGVVTS
jgi:phosphatidylinositol dimannoside acyltransferase